MASLLAAVQGAIAGIDDDDQPDEGATDANASTTEKESRMANTDPKPSGISQTDHDAAIAAATTAGHAAGVTAATDRLSAALGAEGVRGDGVRMAAALDLAGKSPGMSGADVAAFVVANVATSKPTAGTDPAAYDKARVDAAGQALPESKAKEGGGWGSIVAAVNKRR